MTNSATRCSLLVNLDVPDVPRAEAFYVEAFGLTVGRRFDADFVELLGAQAPIYLLKKDAGSSALPLRPTPRDYARHWTPVHLDFVVDRLDEELLRRLESLGATRESEVKEAKYGKLQLMADPFGHGFCLIEFRGRGYDELL